MKELLINELRRFRTTALVTAGVHLVLLVLVNQLYNILQLSMELYMVMLGLYMLAGAGLGLYQFGTYRQPSRWIWLMHRPMAPGRIFASLAGAVAVLIISTIGLPALAIVVSNDLFSSRVVDLRHYLLIPHIMLFVAMAWLCGAYIVLGRSRTAFVLAIVPLWMLLHGASALAMLVPALLCLMLLGAVTFTAMKPNRTEAPKTTGALLAVSLPLHLGFYFALAWGGSLGFQYGQMMFGLHPLNMDIDPPGGFTEATRLETPKLVDLGLSASTDPRAAHWRRQVILSEGTSNSPGPLRYPVRQALGNVQDMSFIAAGTRWSFSHDSMRFEGASLRTGQASGALTMPGGAPFPGVPVRIAISDDFSYLLLPHALLGMQTKGELRTWSLAQFAPQEYLASVPRTFDKRTYVLTNERLIAYRERSNDIDALVPMFDVALPARLSDLATADMVHLLEGTLVSFTYGDKLIDGSGRAEQIVYFVDGQGKAQEVARRELTHDFPSLFEHRAWWLSPAIHGVAGLPARIYDVGATPDGTRFPAPAVPARPAIAWFAALGGMLGAAFGAWWWLRRAPLAPRLKLTWIASCLLLGIPAFLSLIVLQARTRPLAAAPPEAGALAPAPAAT